MVSEQLHGHGLDITNERVLEAMTAVLRHEFVPASETEEAYADHPLPIGHGQTISQPYIVALMTQVLDPQPGNRILEIGTGSGYQSAVLARLVDHVYSVEIIPELAARAEMAHRRAGIANVSIRVGDGHLGWPEAGPFDGIVVTCASESVPGALVAQLAEGGRLILPQGPRERGQDLVLLERHGDRVIRSVLLSVRFVPMTGNG